MLHKERAGEQEITSVNELGEILVISKQEFVCLNDSWQSEA